MTYRPEELIHRLDELVRTYGDWVIWEQGLPCACRATTSLRMAAGCSRCEGNGFLWISPRRLRGILMPAHTYRRLATMGWLTPSDLILGTDSQDRIADFDRITLTTPLPVDPEVIVRGQAHRDGLPGVAPSEDRLAYRAARAVLCFAHDRPDARFIEGDAFVLSGKTLRWLRPPPDGTVYLIKYEALSEWVAFASPIEVIDRGGSLGQRVLLRRAHLVNLRENSQPDARSALAASSL